ncbi:MAG: hypothetical protein OEM26_06165, partial [Saprospiraceae bacterium]|nr:hypothetical protein [Saprospiraceae bacterium]
LLAALIVFLLFCLIIWLSRPLAEKPAPDCPPCDYRCIPITKMIGATATCQKKITLTGTEDKPLLAHITGVEDDCCTPIDARGSNVLLMIGEDSIGWRSGDSIPDLTELTHGQTLRMFIKGRLDITLSDSAALTIFAPIFDTVRARVIHLSNDQCIYEEMSYDIRLSHALEKCFRVADSVVIDSFIRRDTGTITSTHDTTIYALVAHCLEADTLITRSDGGIFWLEYFCGRTRILPVPKLIIIKEPCDCKDCPTSPCDSTVVIDVNCLGDKLADWFEEMPVIRVNGRVLTTGTGFINPIEIPIPLGEDSLRFKIDTPFTFMNDQREIVLERTKYIDLEVFDSRKEVTLQINGDVIVVDRDTNRKIEVQPQDSLKIWLYRDGKPLYEIEQHSPGLFCKEIKDHDFCQMSFQVEWKNQISGQRMLSDYRKVLQRCRDDLKCVDYETTVLFTQ